MQRPIKNNPLLHQIINNRYLIIAGIEILQRDFLIRCGIHGHRNGFIRTQVMQLYGFSCKLILVAFCIICLSI